MVLIVDGNSEHVALEKLSIFLLLSNKSNGLNRETDQITYILLIA